jgi:hypothetical protein
MAFWMPMGRWNGMEWEGFAEGFIGLLFSIGPLKFLNVQHFGISVGRRSSVVGLLSFCIILYPGFPFRQRPAWIDVSIIA